MIPPPPITLPPTLSKTRKKTKRFTLPSNNSSFNSPKTPSQVHDLQMLPFIHYGLDRNMTSFALMDKDNILTHSPTVVSIGGTSFDIGFQSNLLILDLDPKGKYSQDIGLDTSYEFEWKSVETENNDVLKFDNGYASNVGSIIYSKQKQCLYVFGKGYQSWVSCLDLKTLVWRKRNIRNRVNDIETRFVMNYKEDEFIYCSLIGWGGTICLYYIKHTELERIFELSDEKCFHTLSNFKEFIIDNFMNFSMRMFSPFSDNKILTYDGNTVCTVKLNENKKIPQMSIVSEGLNTSVIEIDSKHVLIATEENLHKYNVNAKTSHVLSYSKPAIELKFHKLFPPFIAKFKNRKNENLLIHITNNDILFILKLDYNKPSSTFTKLFQECNYSDIIIKGQH